MESRTKDDLNKEMMNMTRDIAHSIDMNILPNEPPIEITRSNVIMRVQKVTPKKLRSIIDEKNVFYSDGEELEKEEEEDSTTVGNDSPAFSLNTNTFKKNTFTEGVYKLANSSIINDPEIH